MARCQVTVRQLVPSGRIVQGTEGPVESVEWSDEACGREATHTVPVWDGRMARDTPACCYHHDVYVGLSHGTRSEV